MGIGEINYYPTSTHSIFIDKDITEVRSVFEDMVRRLNEIYKQASVDPIRLNESEFDTAKEAFAFFVEANRQQGDEWKDLIQGFLIDCEGIAKKDSKKAATELNWRLSQTISGL